MPAAAAPYRDLIEQFGRGWERGDIDALVGVFHPDVVFLEGPFGERLNGITEVRAYWQDIPFNHAEVKFLAGEIFSAGPWFATEFRCTYRRRRTGDWVDVRGGMFCETKDGKISEMRMYWERRP
jgi:ketosteroid isomerase-like protein